MARIALVSPYAWDVPGGVNGHVAALAAELRVRGEEVLVLAPGGGDAQLGRTVGVPSNDAVSRLALTPSSVARARAALDRFRPDVVHLHEPVAPLVCWDLLGCGRPLVGTFHCHSERVLPHVLGGLAGARRRLRRLHVRIAVSEAAAWTGRRFYGGSYRVVPNGITLANQGTATPFAPRTAAANHGTVTSLAGRVAAADHGTAAPLAPRAALANQVTVPPFAREPVVAFVGQDVPRKGLAVLEAAMRGVPARLVRAGAGEEARSELLRRAAVLAAPSLRGESFGLVLLEAMAHGTPVVASDIAGYREVATAGTVLVPPGDAAALASALRALLADEPRRAALGARGRAHAERFAWPLVADAVQEAYEDARRLAGAPCSLRRRVAVAAGLRSADPEGDAPAGRRAAGPLPNARPAEAALQRWPSAPAPRPV